MRSGKKRYRLLIIPNTLASFGGGEHLAFDMAKKLKSVCDVKILNPVSSTDFLRREKAKLLRDNGINEEQVVDVKCKGVKMKAFGTEEFLFMVPTLSGMHSLSRAIKESDSIYCITHNPMLLMYSLIYAKRHRTKFVFAIQNRIFGSFFGEKQGPFTTARLILYRMLIKSVRFFHSLNSYDSGIVRKYIPGARVYQIPGFATFEDLKMKVNRKKFVALFIGRLPKHQKGVDLFCDVVERVAKKEPNVEFRILGAGGDGEELVRKISAKHPRSVRWLGFMPYEKVKEHYKDASLLVFTARGEELRYFPLVFLEAQSFGLPIVTFEGKGYEGIVTNGVEGSLIRQFDTGEFADSVISYYKIWKSSKDRYLQLKKKVSELTKKKFSDKTVIPKMGEMLRPEKQ